ncbi:hypothetical protein EZL74_04850 [Flavobacterium silvisoli]|uniref:Lipoprotein n=1 Tax=Flavobacterium silvisoli TaxID=2529433 RepID=A0A4Q9Z182_9FLAO|nr:hypothetical protein [Flavobacterium silvisoli]TBX70076.1 hypothetical protein EZL74_04850 [Flavobacterium silvisoli]
MKKTVTLLVFTLVLFSCKLTNKNEEVTDEVNTNVTVKDSSTVNDKDENGCLASAGYIWSKVNKECVKGFSGIQLNPVNNPNNEDETLSAYVLFSQDAEKAEIFLPNDTTSMVLSRSAEGKPWIYQDWQLIPWKGYVLKKGTETKFTGDGEIGKKVTGTDTEQ